ncbi:MAG TPA: hypothetical protein VF128_07550 [Gemmatimonadaceae bacterium]
MTLRERVAGTGQTLAVIALVRSFLLGIASGLAVAALAWPFTSVSNGPAVGSVLGTLTAIATAWWIYRRIRGAGFSVTAVSLWIEEHQPTLRYGLVTAVEGNAPSLEQRLTGIDWSPAVRGATRQALVGPGIAVLATAILLAASISFAPAVSRLADRVTSGDRPVGGSLDITIDVTPPAYARRRSESLRNPPVIRALVGSEVRVVLAGTADFAVTAGDAAVPAGSAWRVTSQPIALRVQSGGNSRLVAVDPIPDSAPSIRIREPARDTVLAVPSGTFTLGADLHDDLGLGRAAFEYIVSSGSGESFTFASGTLGARTFDGSASGTIVGRLSLGSLNLKPGDFVHVRAVAYDRRPDTAAARGVSETRTIRIARTGEFDSVAVDAAAPPEADKAILSQRMLINMAEALVRRRPRLARTTFSDESRTIARDQARLRKQVGDLVFSRLGDDASGEHFHGDGHEHEGQELRPAMTPDELLKAAENAASAAAGRVLDFEGDETPVVAVNRPLLEAYNFMWDAGRELDQASPERALPAMYRALEAIQRARAAERLYLRSRPPRAVVDVDRVRLQGKEKGTPAAREPRTLATGGSRNALARFARVVRLASADPASAADSLLLLRIDLLGTIPAAAASAAADAADALRNGRDATASLGLVRRSLGRPLRAGDSLSRWSGVP